MKSVINREVRPNQLLPTTQQIKWGKEEQRFDNDGETVAKVKNGDENDAKIPFFKTLSTSQKK